MKTFFFYISFIILSGLSCNAQVGIGTTTPHATLDILASNSGSPQNNEGILIPRVDNFPITNPTANQDGMLVFTTGNGTPSKGFYYWDNALTNWVLISGTTVGGGGNTLDQAYDQNGSGLGRTIIATDGAVRINGEDGFLVTGSLGSGNTIDNEVTGAGTRMFFNPNRSAFRAGTIFDFFPLPTDQWDHTNIGDHSTAFGINTLASGNTSTAFGSFTTASGSASTAFGSFTTASTDRATAFGSQTDASGVVSTAFGNQTTASATNATAFGFASSAIQTHSTAFGVQSVASGITATAFGNASEASGNTSTAFGSNTDASGQSATAFGLQTVASGQNSTAFGDNSEASGFVSTAFGRFSVASGFGSTALGLGTTALSSYEIALGMYNSTYTPVVSGNGFDIQDRLLVIGNGVDSVNRSDVLTIYKNGITRFHDNVGIGTQTPTANLSVNGTANKTGGGTWAVFSDKRLKHNVSNYKEGLELILKVNPVNFSYNKTMSKILGANTFSTKKVFQGVIAQELQKIAPEMVREVEVGNQVFLEVDPNRFTYALINAMKEQQQVIEKQNERIQRIENQLKTLLDASKK